MKNSYFISTSAHTRNIKKDFINLLTHGKTKFADLPTHGKSHLPTYLRTAKIICRPTYARKKSFADPPTHGNFFFAVCGVYKFTKLYARCIFFIFSPTL